ncbi:hypothetical protein MBANPS3_012474, partial [Mucor bainieri]
MAALPNEIWFCVLQNIHAREDVLQCRLVCRAWNSVTEEAVFSNGISFGISHTSMQILYQRLLAKPSLCQRINKINLDMPFTADLELVVSIMKKVMDRNVKTITGAGATDLEIYGMLYKIARESDLKLAQVEEVPTPRDFGELYYNVLQLFKKSLKRLVLLFNPGSDQYMASIWSELEEFKSLKHVYLQKLDFRDTMHLNDFLNKVTCGSVRLAVRVASINEAPGNQEAMKHWCQGIRIKQVFTVKTLHLIATRSPHNTAVLLFVLYKFPQLDSLRISSFDGDTHYETIFGAIKHIPNLDVDCQFRNSSSAIECIELLRGHTNSIKIKYSKRTRLVKIAAQKTSRRSNYEITLPTGIDGLTHLKVLSNFASSGISSLELDIGDLCLCGPYSPSTFLHEVLSSARQTERLVYRCFYVVCETKPDFIMPNLKTLTMIDASMGDKVLANLSTISPSLADITLDTCVISNSNVWPVNMPYSSLEVMTIKCDVPATRDNFDIYEMNDDFDDEYNQENGDFEAFYKPEPGLLQNIRKHNLVLGNSAYLGLLLLKKKKFFRLSAEGSVAIPITEDEFQKNIRSSPTFLFNLESLKMLKIRLGNFSVTLKFDGEYNLIPRI